MIDQKFRRGKKIRLTPDENLQSGPNYQLIPLVNKILAYSAASGRKLPAGHVDVGAPEWSNTVTNQSCVKLKST